MTVSDLDKRNKALALFEKWNAACREREDAPEGMDDAAFEQLEKAEDEAYHAYHGAGCLIHNESGDDIERCAITGVPLLVSDDIAMVLRSALPQKTEKAA